MLKQIDHVALIVEDLGKAIALYESNFRVQICSRERNEEQGFEMVAFRVGESTIELVAPTSPDSLIGKFLAKRGPGIHHLAFGVEDLYECTRSCQEQGLVLIDREPRRGTDDSKIVFLHPKSTMGTLIELVEPASHR